MKASFLSNEKTESLGNLLRKFLLIIEHTLKGKKFKTHAFNTIRTCGGAGSVVFRRSGEQGDFQCKRCYSISGDPFNLFMLGKKEREQEISYNSLLHSQPRHSRETSSKQFVYVSSVFNLKDADAQ